MENTELASVSNLLTQHFQCNVDVREQKVKLLTNPGEHYGSVILGLDLIVEVKGELKTLSLVAKLIPFNELLRTAFDVQVTFKKESSTYSIVIPTLIGIQREFSFPEEKLLKFFPKCYGVRSNLEGNDGLVDKNAVILFENLKKGGYETIDRLTGFDLEGAKIVISNLARFHAVPLALRLLRPEEFERKIMPSLVRHRGPEQLGDEVINVMCGAIMKAVKKCDDLLPYHDRLMKITAYFEKHPYTERPVPSQDYGTVTHCDLWTSNIMVLKDLNNSYIDCKFLDFQLTNYSSPIRDLIFFLFTSLQQNILLQSIDPLIKLYYDNFIDTLKYFKVDLEPYTWENFNKELEQVAPDEVYHVLFMLKIIFSERGQVTNTIDKFELSDWTRDELIGEKHREKMRDTVLAFVSKKWI